MRDRLATVKTEMKEDLSRIEGKIDSLSGDIEEHKNKTATELSMTVTTVHSELERNVLTNVTKELKKTADCILEQVYECGGIGWRRVVYLNMTDPNTNCPPGWQLTSHSKRTCGKVNTSRFSCDSVFFSVSGGDYTSVCGSIRAYQYGHIDAFEAYHLGRVTTIEGAYVSGVSLTHGSPRQHIW
ncbi:hypothetical protein GBAR_LOCUS5292, partial [Geodia barretti]